MCFLMDQGRIKSKCDPGIINACFWKVKYLKNNYDARVLDLGCHGEGVPYPPMYVFPLAGCGWVL